MAYRPGNINYKTRVDEEAKPWAGYSSAGENFAAGVGLIFDEESSISSVLHSIDTESQAKKIRSLIASGDIDQSVADSFTTRRPGRSGGYRVSYNEIAKYANENLDIPEHIETRDDMISERNAELSVLRRERERVFDTSLTGGKVSAFAGMAAASTLDPVNAATMMVATPLIGVKGLSKTMYSLSTAGRMASINMAASVPVEPFIHSWKEEIGEDGQYTIADSLFNIGAAGVLAGSIGGFAARFGKSFEKLEALNFATKEYESLLGMLKKSGMKADEAENVAKELSDANSAPDPDMPAEEYLKNKESVRSTLNDGDADSEPPLPIDPEDELLIEAAYSEIPEDFTVILEDGTVTTYKDIETDLKMEIDSLNEKAGCLGGS